MPRPRLSSKGRVDLLAAGDGPRRLDTPNGDGPQLKSLGLPPLEDGNNSDEYIDTSLGRCGGTDINDEEYIKASHDLLTRSTDALIPRSAPRGAAKRLRLPLDVDDCPLFSGNSSAEEKSPWIEVRKREKRRRKSTVVKRVVRNDSDSDDCNNTVQDDLSADSERVQTVEIHRPEGHREGACESASAELTSVPFTVIQDCENTALRDWASVYLLPDQHGYICHLCKYSAKMAYLMENHMKTTHLNEQPYMCMTCRKTFHQRGTAMSHIRIRHPQGSQMVIDQKTETRQTDECNKLLERIYRCHVCESKTAVSKHQTNRPDGKTYVCSAHAKNYSLGVNIVHLYQQ